MTIFPLICFLVVVTVHLSLFSYYSRGGNIWPLNFTFIVKSVCRLAWDFNDVKKSANSHLKFNEK